MNTQAIAAIFGLTALGVTALIMGVNGTLLAALMAAIGGLGGYGVGKKANQDSEE